MGMHSQHEYSPNLTPGITENVLLYARGNNCKLECMICGGQFITTLQYNIEGLHAYLWTTVKQSWQLFMNFLSCILRSSKRVLRYQTISLDQPSAVSLECKVLFFFWGSWGRHGVTEHSVNFHSDHLVMLPSRQTHGRAYYTRLQFQVCPSARHRVPALN